MTALRRVLALFAMAFMTLSSAAAETMESADNSDFHATADVYDFILTIAGPTATAPGGNGKSQRVVTLSRNASGELVVTSMQAIAAEGTPNLPDGTVAVLIARPEGMCAPPHGEDYRPLFKRIFTFVVDHSGKTIWELGYVAGTGSIRTVKSPTDFGPEESFNIDPARYKTYPCANYN